MNQNSTTQPIATPRFETNQDSATQPIKSDSAVSNGPSPTKPLKVLWILLFWLISVTQVLSARLTREDISASSNILSTVLSVVVLALILVLGLVILRYQSATKTHNFLRELFLLCTGVGWPVFSFFFYVEQENAVVESSLVVLLQIISLAIISANFYVKLIILIVNCVLLSCKDPSQADLKQTQFIFRIFLLCCMGFLTTIALSYEEPRSDITKTQGTSLIKRSSTLKEEVIWKNLLHVLPQGVAILDKNFEFIFKNPVIEDFLQGDTFDNHVEFLDHAFEDFRVREIIRKKAVDFRDQDDYIESPTVTSSL